MPDDALSRSASFPPDFVFGVATSSIQIDGGSGEAGRGVGVWDTFSKGAGAIVDGSNPETTCDHFHKYKEDVAEMKRLGLDAYRFSISWPRLFPDASGKLNQEGVSFYNDLINTIIEAGLIPFVTLYHWDLPQYLQDDPHVKGWETRNIIEHFLSFADACFRHFGDRVKHWITFNEIHLFTLFSYKFGVLAPGKSSDPSTSVYTMAHHQLLSHAAVVKLYKKHYKMQHGGFMGVSADVTCYEPMSETEEDRAAVIRSQEFEMGWILDPVHFGDYPQVMKELVGEKLPRFTSQEIEELKQSIDFIGVNYYFAMWATKRKEETPFGIHAWREETQCEFHWFDANGKPLGEVTGKSYEGLFRSCPWGLRKVLKTLKDRYGDIPIYITENGTVDSKPDDKPDELLNDHPRIQFLQDHLSEISDSIRLDGVDVKGYFHWTFLDDWEWMSGFTTQYGLYHVDFTDPELPRKPKLSAQWLSTFLRS